MALCHLVELVRGRQPTYACISVINDLYLTAGLPKVPSAKTLYSTPKSQRSKHGKVECDVAHETPLS